MANIKSFPNNQDVYIGAEDVMKWLHGRTSGVFAAEGNASVSALVDSSMAVTVSDGLGWMANAGKDGVVWWIDNEATTGSKLQLAIDPADGILNRIDRIIVEWKTTNYVDYPEVKVLKGTNSSRATEPSLTNNSTVRQISLAKINVAAGTTAITHGMITDERLDASVCGLVAEGVGIDTSVMQNQFEALLSAIQTELQDLNSGTAALMKAGGTMYGALNMGNNKIQNVATPKDDNDATNKKYVDEKLSMELLWENANSSSSFTAQTVTVANVGQNFTVIEYRASSSSSTYALSTFIRTNGTTVPFDYFTNAGKLQRRRVKATTTTVTFEKGLLDNDEDNSLMIPVRIYAVKGANL